MIKRSQIVKVSLWGIEVGRLTWSARTGVALFSFNPEFSASGLNLLPLRQEMGVGATMMPVWGERGKYQSLPPFIADSLPDAWGNRLFDMWAARNKMSSADISALDKLSFIGKRGIGAFEFEPELEKKPYKEPIDMKELVELAKNVFEERSAVRVAADEPISMQLLISVGTSAGGRQPKAIVARNRTTGEIRSGQVAGLAGYDYLIVKFGDSIRNTAELEMSYYMMAKKAQIQMMDSFLMDVGGERHFATKRFDRTDDGEKLHTQTLAAIAPGTASYEQFFYVCRKLNLSELSISQLFRRMVFNILSNNTDDHDKNVSFIMDRNGKWTLAPAYDVTFIFNYGGFQPETERCMSLAGKTRNITREEVVAFARENGVRQPEKIINQVISSLREFRTIATDNHVNDKWIGIVEAAIDSNISKWEKTAEDETFVASGHTVEKFRIERAFKGNYHIEAIVDGTERKYILTHKHELYQHLESKGLANLTIEDKCKLSELLYV